MPRHVSLSAAIRLIYTAIRFCSLDWLYKYRGTGLTVSVFIYVYRQLPVISIYTGNILYIYSIFIGGTRNIFVIASHST